MPPLYTPPSSGNTTTTGDVILNTPTLAGVDTGTVAMPIVQAYQNATNNLFLFEIDVTKVADGFLPTITLDDGAGTTSTFYNPSSQTLWCWLADVAANQTYRVNNSTGSNTITLVITCWVYGTL